jgi:hypothetical protein
MSVAPNPVADPTSIRLSDVAAPSAIVTSVTLSSPALRRVPMPWSLLSSGGCRLIFRVPELAFVRGRLRLG